tara:strand:- start:22 stop:519 length:498 start_codon:yes stop_codon:yes gene_type:complete
MNNIILITGADGSGKDTVAKLIAKEIQNSSIHSIKGICVGMYQDLVSVNWNKLSGAEKRIHRPVFSNFCEGIKITLGKRVFAEYLAKKLESQDDTTFIVPDWRFKEEYEVFREKFNLIKVKVIGTNNESVITDDLSEYVCWEIDSRDSIERTKKTIKSRIETLGL